MDNIMKKIISPFGSLVSFVMCAVISTAERRLVNPEVVTDRAATNFIKPQKNTDIAKLKDEMVLLTDICYYVIC